jgi:hypothetical protein
MLEWGRHDNNDAHRHKRSAYLLKSRQLKNRTEVSDNVISGDQREVVANVRSVGIVEAPVMPRRRGAIVPPSVTAPDTTRRS